MFVADPAGNPAQLHSLKDSLLAQILGDQLCRGRLRTSLSSWNALSSVGLTKVELQLSLGWAQGLVSLECIQQALSYDAG